MNNYKIPLHIDFKSLRNIDIDKWIEIKQIPRNYLYKHNLKDGDIIYLWGRYVIQIIPFSIWKNNKKHFYCTTWGAEPYKNQDWRASVIKHADNTYFYYGKSAKNKKEWLDPNWRRKVEIEKFL